MLQRFAVLSSYKCLNKPSVASALSKASCLVHIFPFSSDILHLPVPGSPPAHHRCPAPTPCYLALCLTET